MRTNPRNLFMFEITWFLEMSTFKIDMSERTKMSQRLKLSCNKLAVCDSNVWATSANVRISFFSRKMR